MKKSPIAPLFETDAYKLFHVHAYKPGTEYVYSNYTNRSNKYVPYTNHAVAFGLQAFIQNYVMDAFEDFFVADEDTVIKLYEARINNVLGPNRIGSDHIRALHRKGYLPLIFKSVKEGTLVPFGVPTLTIENTDPAFYWLTNYIETALSASIWYPSTNATKTIQARKLLEAWAEKTGGNKEFIDWQWHDFSLRGQHSLESGAASGAAHLLLFRGTDNLNTLEWINYFYPGDNGFIGGSVSATEHSTMTSFGKDHEFDAYEYLIDTNPEGILSVVSDTYNLWTVITDFLPRLHEKIMARNGKLVIRPDSGDPTDILAGTVHELGMGDTPEEKGLIELLWDEFGGVVNDKGFKTLDQHIGAIYGDSINLERAEDIFTRLANKGFASDNIVYGAGSYFAIGQTTRDSLSSAVKATWVQINGEGHDIFKDPITAGGSKKSATGRLAVLKDTDGELYLVQHATPEQEAVSELQTVWKDGKWVRKQSYADVRETLRKNIEQHW